MWPARADGLRQRTKHLWPSHTTPVSRHERLRVCVGTRLIGAVLPIDRRVSIPRIASPANQAPRRLDGSPWLGRRRAWFPTGPRGLEADRTMPLSNQQTQSIARTILDSVGGAPYARHV